MRPKLPQFSICNFYHFIVIFFVTIFSIHIRLFCHCFKSFHTVSILDSDDEKIKTKIWLKPGANVAPLDSL